jgi:hypothetical protein
MGFLVFVQGWKNYAGRIWSRAGYIPLKIHGREYIKYNSDENIIRL